MLPRRQLSPGSFENQPRPKSCSAIGKFHQEKQKGNRKANAENLNEILNCAILTLKTTPSQAKEAEKQSTPTFQRLAFLWCAVIMGLLAPQDRTEKCLPKGLPLPSLLTLAMLTRCSQAPVQSTINGQNRGGPPQGSQALCH